METGKPEISDLTSFSSSSRLTEKKSQKWRERGEKKFFHETSYTHRENYSSDYHYQGKLNPLLSSGRLTLRYAWPRTPCKQKSSFAKAGAPERVFTESENIVNTPKGQLISKCLGCHRLDQNTNENFSRISALAYKKRSNQKLYYINYVK